VSIVNSLAMADGSGSKVKSPLFCVNYINFRLTILRDHHTFFNKVDLMQQISNVLERTDFSGWDTKRVKDRKTDFRGSGVSTNLELLAKPVNYRIIPSSLKGTAARDSTDGLKSSPPLINSAVLNALPVNLITNLSCVTT